MEQVLIGILILLVILWVVEFSAQPWPGPISEAARSVSDAIDNKIRTNKQKNIDRYIIKYEILTDHFEEEKARALESNEVRVHRLNAYERMVLAERLDPFYRLVEETWDSSCGHIIKIEKKKRIN